VPVNRCTCFSVVWSVTRTQSKLVNSHIHFADRTVYVNTDTVVPSVRLTAWQKHARLLVTVEVRLSWYPVGVVHCGHCGRVWRRHSPHERGPSRGVYALSSRPVHPSKSTANRASTLYCSCNYYTFNECSQQMLLIPIIRPPGTAVPDGLMFYPWCFFYFFTTLSPRPLDRSPWNFATWSESGRIL